MDRTARSSMRLAGLAAALCVVALAITAALPGQALAARTYGPLCSTYESGNDPACIDSACAYGAYQMSYDNAKLFAKSLAESSNSTYKAWGKKLKAAKSTSSFNSAWRSISKSDKSGFFTAQYVYCKRAYYNPTITYIKKIAPGFKPSLYTYALRGCLFSTALQHGPYGAAYKIFKPAMKSLGGWNKKLTEKQLINAIYYERSRVTSSAPGSPAYKIASTSASRSYGINGQYLAHFYSCGSAVQIGVYNRLHNLERKDALAWMKKLKALAADPKHTITYTVNGGIQAAGQKTSFRESTATFKLKKPTRTGYKFLGWYTSSSFKTKVTEVKQGTKKDLTLFAKWTALKDYQVVITPTKGISIHTEANLTSEITGTIKHGKTVSILKSYKNMGQLANGKGWIHLKHLEMA